MASPEVEAEIKKSEALAKKMGVNGTPHFLVGDRAIPGAPEDLHDQLAKNVSELRKSVAPTADPPGPAAASHSLRAGRGP